MREDGTYSAEEFKQRRGEIENKLVTAQVSYGEAKIETFDIEAAVNYATDQISNLPACGTSLHPLLNHGSKNSFSLKESSATGPKVFEPQN